METFPECHQCRNLKELMKKYPENETFFRYKTLHCMYCEYIRQVNTSDSIQIKTNCCKNPEIVIDPSYSTCKNCGTVTGFHGFESAVKFTETGQLDLSTCLTDNGVVNLGMNTTIQGDKYSRVQKYMTVNKRDLNIYKELNIDNITMSLSNNIKDAYIYKFLSVCGEKGGKHHTFKGKRRTGMKAVCLWVVHKDSGINRSYIDICQMYGISKKIFERELKRYNDICGENIQTIDTNNDIVLYIECLKGGDICNLTFKDAKIINGIIKVLYTDCYIRNTHDIGNKIAIYFFLKLLEEETKTLNNPFVIDNKIFKVFSMSRYSLENNYRKLFQFKDDILKAVKKNFIMDIRKRSRLC